jgi:hypothetical protein
MGTKIQGGGDFGFTVADTSTNQGNVITETVDANNDGVIESVGVYTAGADGFSFYGGGDVGSNQEAVDFLNSIGLNEVVQQQGLDFPPEIRSKLGAFSSALSDFSASNIQNTQQQWAEFLTDLKTGGIPMDVNSLVQYVLREAYMENTKGLQFYAQKVSFFNKLKDGIRKELTDARKLYSGMETGQLDPVNRSKVSVGGANGIDPSKVTSGDPSTVTIGEYTIKVTSNDPRCNGYPCITIERNGSVLCEVWGDPHISMGKSHDSTTMGKGANFWEGSNIVLPGGICIEMGTKDMKRGDGAYGVGAVTIHRGTDAVTMDTASNPPTVSPVSYDGGYSTSGKQTFVINPDGLEGQQLWLDETGDGTVDGLAYTSNYSAQQTVASASNAASDTVKNIEKQFSSNVSTASAAADESSSYNYYEKTFSMAMDPATGKPYPPTPDSSHPITSKDDAKNYCDALEEKLNSVGDDAQLANVDLQNMLQKQQQTLQMLSNISKMLNDTAMSVIRKIGG